MVHKTVHVCDFGAWSALKTSSPNSLPITQFMPATLPLSETVLLFLKHSKHTASSGSLYCWKPSSLGYTHFMYIFAQMLSRSNIFSNHTSKKAHSCLFLPLLYLPFFKSLVWYYIITFCVYFVFFTKGSKRAVYMLV